MLKKTLLSTLGLAALLTSNAYAADCKTTFDSSCLAHRYNRARVDYDAAVKQSEITRDLHAHTERLEKQAEQQREDARVNRIVDSYNQLNADMERRHQERRADAKEDAKRREELWKLRYGR